MVFRAAPYSSSSLPHPTGLRFSSLQPCTAAKAEEEYLTHEKKKRDSAYASAREGARRHGNASPQGVRACYALQTPRRRKAGLGGRGGERRRA